VQKKHGGRVVKETYGGEYVTVELKVSELEKLFATEFYELEYTPNESDNVKSA
jgi:hypothetical protein